jgi:hypothetical protein
MNSEVDMWSFLRGIVPPRFLRAKDVRARTRQAYLEYLSAMEEWNGEIERLALREPPKAWAGLRDVFQLQRLYSRRSALRLRCLLECHPRRLEAADTFSALSRLVETEFGADDEAIAKRDMVEYGVIDAELARLKAIGRPANEDLFRALQHDPEWGKLVRALNRRLERIEKRAGLPERTFTDHSVS